MKTVGILLFDEVEVLDFAGPFEVFSVCGRRAATPPFEVFTVAEHARPIRARGNLLITPTHSFASCPQVDLLVVPGGYGTRTEMVKPVVLDWVSARAQRAELVLSVCTGALILGRCGLLDRMAVTTHHGAIEELKSAAPAALVQADRRVIDNGKFVLAAGISSGIDAAFHVVARLLGHEVARETAHYMEYPLSLQSESSSPATA